MPRSSSEAAGAATLDQPPAPSTYLRLALTLAPVRASARSPAALDLTGPVLRGVLGKTLVDAFCPFGEPRCDQKGKGRGSPAPPSELCHLATACPYGVLFAASHSRGPGRRPPYALFVSDDALEITLFGPAWRQYAWIVAVLHGALGDDRPVRASTVCGRTGAASA